MKKFRINELHTIRGLAFVIAIGSVVTLWSGNPVSAQTEPNFVASPTPSASELIPPGTNVPIEIASWFGRWEGRWEDRWPMVIAVTGFEERDGTWFAKVRYYWKERVSEPYRSRRSSNNWARVTPTEIETNRMTLYRRHLTDQMACASGAFSKPRSATLFWRSHDTEFQDNHPGFLELSAACYEDRLS